MITYTLGFWKKIKDGHTYQAVLEMSSYALPLEDGTGFGPVETYFRCKGMWYNGASETVSTTSVDSAINELEKRGYSPCDK